MAPAASPPRISTVSAPSHDALCRTYPSAGLTDPVGPEGDRCGGVELQNDARPRPLGVRRPARRIGHPDRSGADGQADGQKQQQHANGCHDFTSISPRFQTLRPGISDFEFQT
jgi:hypothetical protein